MGKEKSKRLAKSDEFPKNIVALGASAGGLTPITEFFQEITDDTGMAYVVLQHLSPDHKSMMAELISKHTPMEVFVAEEGLAIKRDCIYLIPHTHKITIQRGRLRLHPTRATGEPNDAIDVFLKSLAEDQQKKAVAIIFSGTGSDGAEGIIAVKKAGGTTIVQDPLTAEFDGMPNSAVDTGCADLVLAASNMPSELLEFLEDTPLLRSMKEAGGREEELYAEIISMVNDVARHDFGHYKRPTIQRRLAKRMRERDIASLEDYRDYLASNTAELKTLSQEFLINVTRFFRDKEAFEVLYRVVLPDIFKDTKPGDLVKVWSVACSSGEEPYSLAMLFRDYMDADKKDDVAVKIFATDVDEDALSLAMQGVYTASALKEVSHERKLKYFSQQGAHYRINPDLRKMVVFARHDISKDAPYSKIDLVSCRNMLIYMSPILQNGVLQALHYSVKERGYLLLGPSENLGSMKDSFEETDRKWKIFKCARKPKFIQRERFDVPINLERNFVQPNVGKHRNALNHLPEVFYNTILDDDYAGIFIDRELTVKHAVGKFRRFINFPETSFNLNLLKLVPVDLSMALSLAVRNAIKTDEKVVMKKVKVIENGILRSINLVVKPFLDQRDFMQPFLFIVLSEEEFQVVENLDAVPASNHAAVERIDDLEMELQTTRQNLQSLIEQVESSNEELQSTNEEMSASHEQLQSSNEELQSLNEELHTVNAEHQQKIKELNELNDDLANYLGNATVGQIFLDKRLRIQRFTPAIIKQINVKDLDVGRSIMDISTNFQNVDFINEVKSVMRSGRKLERETVMQNERVFLMTISPYVRRDKKVDGVIITFTDISQVKELSNLVTAIFEASPNAIIACKAVRDATGKVSDFKYTAVNAAAERNFKASIGKSIDHNFAGTQQDFIEFFADVVEQGTSARIDFEDDRIWYQMSVTRLGDGVLATLFDITDRKEAQASADKGYADLQLASGKLHRLNDLLEKSNLDLMQFASIASHDLKEPLRKIQIFSDMLAHQLEGKLSERDADLFNRIISAAARMKLLIDDVLAFSKLSVDEIPFGKVNMSSLLKAIKDDLEIPIKEKNLQVQIDRLPTVFGNVMQISQVFQNLISNAIKFNDKKKPVITITARALTKAECKRHNIEPDKFHVIEVADNGIGIDNQFSEKIFGIFQRLNSSLKYAGSGIGLAICKKIMDSHKGFIKVEGKVGKGTKFFVGFPKKTVHDKHGV